MSRVDISPAEFILLRILQELEESDLTGLVDKANERRSEGEKEWVSATVQSFLLRLINKGFVTRYKVWGRWVYRAQITLWDSVEGFLCKFFGTSGRSLLCCYLLTSNGKSLSKKEKKVIMDLVNTVEDEKVRTVLLQEFEKEPSL